MSALEQVDTAAVRPLEAHADWTAADVADSDTWTHQLTSDEISELEAALVAARAHSAEVLDVDKEHFPPPTPAPVLHGLAEELVNGAEEPAGPSGNNRPRGCVARPAAQ